MKKIILILILVLGFISCTTDEETALTNLDNNEVIVSFSVPSDVKNVFIISGGLVDGSDIAGEVNVYQSISPKTTVLIIGVEYTFRWTFSDGSTNADVFDTYTIPYTTSTTLTLVINGSSISDYDEGDITTQKSFFNQL